MRKAMPVILAILLGLSFSSVSFAAGKKSAGAKKETSEMTKKKKSRHSMMSKKETKEDPAQMQQSK